LHAFDEAMQQFGMSRSGLLQLFRRVGVTELEARRGTLPPASQRWQRILQALGAQRASAPMPCQQSRHAFAGSPEHELDAPSQMYKAGRALAGTSGTPPGSDDSLGCSSQQPTEVPVPEQPESLHAYLPGGWGRKRRRTNIGGGLPDPGTPTRADLAASSTVFQRQDAATCAATEHEFRAFNDEEMTWLMALFP